MKNSVKIFGREFNHTKILTFLAIIIISTGVYAQSDCQVTGKIVEEKSNQPVPFATVVMMTASGDIPQIISGVITDENGTFTFSQLKTGEYRLQASSVGYKTSARGLDITDPGIYDAGTIYLQDSIQLLGEIIVVGDRPRGKTENDKTIFLMNRKILAASGNAPDLLRHIPGIQVDLKQNIMLEGSGSILLLVNGKERDKSYISQLNPSLIDRIEIINTPPSNYDGNISGVINIILKMGDDTGLSGQFFTEIPTSGSVVYSFPSYSIQYGFKKFNLFTSYNGEINFEDIDEKYKSQTRRDGHTVNISSVEQVRQKNLSHKFHYGFDYHATSRDIFNFYGSVNPYSYEQDGEVFMDITGDENLTWNSRREETDKNLNVFNSLYYKHLFNKPGGELVIDLTSSYLVSGNSVSYFNGDETATASIFNNEKPEQLLTAIKIDYSNPLGENLIISTGAKARVNSMQNETNSRFGYNEQVYALYWTLHYKKPGYSLNSGIRAEYADTELKNDLNKRELSVLPYLTFQYRINEQQNLLLSYRRSVNRPGIFQLNPYTSIDNPYYARKGNPLLQPEFINHIYAEHSFRFKASYLSYRLFYKKLGNAIDNLTFLNDSTAFETQVQNLGNIHQAGMQFMGSLKFGPLTLSPTIRLYNQSTSANSLAQHYNIENKNNWVLDAGLSAVVSFRHDFAFSGTFRYTTVDHHIQEALYCDALYILSLDKTFRNNLKTGIMVALPFAGSFVYQGSDTEAQDFNSLYRGNLKLPALPFMFRLSYHFQSGEKRAMISREKEELPKRLKPGL